MENKNKKTVGLYGGKFWILTTGHLFALAKARSQVDKLYVWVAHHVDRDKKLCEKNGIKYASGETRGKWLKEVTKDWDNVEIIVAEDWYEGTLDDMWREGARIIKNLVPEKITHVFSSESSYEKYWKQYYGEDIEHIVLDEERSNFNVSATKVGKEGIYANWDFIPKVAKPFYTKKVAIVGTESCGKTTVVQTLATLFNTSYVEEYGRVRCEEMGDGSNFLTKYNYQEFAYGHKHYEYRKLLDSNKVLFIDSDAVITQYYAELYQGERYEFLDSVIDTQDYDLYIFLEPDVKWVSDGYREHGDELTRQLNNEKLKAMYREYGINFVSVGGSYDERLTKCVEIVSELLSPNKEAVSL